MDVQASQRPLSEVTDFFDATFHVPDLPTDPAFSRFAPMVYDAIGFPWRDAFEPEFAQRFNGLMLKGHDGVGKVWCIAFPAEAVLEHVLARSRPGDLIFAHHPIDMRCGDPRGQPRAGEGFVPIAAGTLRRLQAAGLSFYACHVPLDIHPTMSTSDAIVRVIGGRVVDHFLPYGWGFAGRLCEVTPTGVEELIAVCRRAVGLPYVDLQGDAGKQAISRIAVVAGGAGDVEFYREADRLGADCLIAGEVTSKIGNEIGYRKQREIAAYLPTTALTAIGLSHAGSEFLVMRELAPLIERRLGLPAEAVPEAHWWR